MAEVTTPSDVFKFVALRPPVTAAEAKLSTTFIVDDRQPEQTPVGDVFTSLMNDPASIPDRIAEFIRANGYALGFPGSENPPPKVFALAIAFTKQSYAQEKLADGIRAILGTEPVQWLDSDHAQRMLADLWDRYYAFLILSRAQSVDLAILTDNLRAFHLLKHVAANTPVEFFVLQELLSSKPIVAKLFTQPARPAPPPLPPPTALNAAKQTEYKRLWEDLIDTQRALEEIKSLRFESKTDTKVTDLVMLNRETGREAQSKLSIVKNQLIVSPRGIQALHPSTKRIVGDAILQPTEFQPLESIAKLQSSLNTLYTRAFAINDPAFMEVMPVDAKQFDSLTPITRSTAKNLSFPQATSPRPECGGTVRRSGRISRSWK